MIPTFHVYRLAGRPAYVARREALKRADATKAKYTTPWPEWNIPAVLQAGHTKRCDRNYGEFLTTRQAANALGVKPKTVRKLHHRGRLHGGSRVPELDAYKEALGIGHRGRGNRWLFFRKAEVYALRRDPEYCKRRRALLLGKSPERRAAREAAEEKRQVKLIEAFGRTQQRRAPTFAPWPSYTGLTDQDAWPIRGRW